VNVLHLQCMHSPVESEARVEVTPLAKCCTVKSEHKMDCVRSHDPVAGAD
jgi:hypothetical protein